MWEGGLVGRGSAGLPRLLPPGCGADQQISERSSLINILILVPPPYIEVILCPLYVLGFLEHVCVGFCLCPGDVCVSLSQYQIISTTVAAYYSLKSGVCRVQIDSSFLSSPETPRAKMLLEH